ncbi:hypothetical protein [uncultured Tenacibaculum sp.]|uniref:hypothetical protein n=1 Tax=uncultured Tenacibaculum sp. TaxID=174713 RepID=UPI002623EDBD|nr:hypothetical protein [uncultured Tenacibaculum sp.]
MKKFFLLFTVIILQSCNPNGDCNDTFDAVFYCPNSFNLSFKLIDKNSNENLIQNNTISKDDINIIRENDNTIVETFLDTTTYTIYIENYISESETLNYSVKLSDEDSFNISATAKVINSGGCCASTVEISNIKIENTDFEIENNIYNIFIE